MGGSTLTSSLIVRLLDQVTGPARKVGAALVGLNRTANGVSGSFGARLGAAIERNNDALDRSRGRMVDAIGGFYALKAAIGAPIMKATEFESKMLDIAQKADLSDAAIAKLRGRILAMSKDLGASSSAMALSIDDLLGKGMSPDDAMAIIGPITKTAAAYRAVSAEIASASFSVMDNLKVPAEDVAKALDIMAQAGKDGAFELKDMSTEFPALTARAQALGMKGTDAVARLSAALQIARKGAGTSAEAANNVANLMQKVISPETTKKFKSFGIDIRSELKKTQAAGGDVFEMIANETIKATKGDLSKIGDIFQDAQVQGALLPLIQNLKEYQKIRDDAGKANGVVDDDFERRIKTSQGALDRFNSSMERLAVSVGNALLPLVQLTDNFTVLANKLTTFSEKYPGLTRNVVSAAASLIAFRVATSALSFVGLLGRGGALSMLALGFNTVGRAAIGATRAVRSAVGLQTALGAMSGMRLTGIQTVAVALRAMVFAVPGVSAIASALGAIGATLATISAPAWGLIALGVAAVAGAGLLVYKYWDRLSSFIGGFARRIGDGLASAYGSFRGWVRGMVGNIAEYYGADAKAAQDAFDRVTDFSAVMKRISALFDGVKAKLVEFKDYLLSFFHREVLGDDQKAAFSKAGYDLADSMINAVKAAFDGLVEWFRSLPSRILAAIGKIDISSLIDFGSIRAKFMTSLGFGASDPAPAAAPSNGDRTVGHRAKGGPVWPGSSFLVGENGPERFTPPTQGAISPASGTSKSSISLGPFHFHGAFGSTAELQQAVTNGIADALGQTLRGVHSDSGAWS